jgi:hypothetical protein
MGEITWVDSEILASQNAVESTIGLPDPDQCIRPPDSSSVMVDPTPRANMFAQWRLIG